MMSSTFSMQGRNFQFFLAIEEIVLQKKSSSMHMGVRENSQEKWKGQKFHTDIINFSFKIFFLAAVTTTQQHSQNNTMLSLFFIM